MNVDILIDASSNLPIYKQLVEQFEGAIRSGALKPGEQIASMNDFSAQMGISKETVKKTYGILREKGLIIPQQGKGFYVAEIDKSVKPRVLVVFDKLSVYKEVLFNSFAETLGEGAEITILTHNQDLALFSYFLDTNLDNYDYYVIAPHFPLDNKSQARAAKLISRIPNRKLIMIDYWLQRHKGNYGVVYQDFENDAYEGLLQGLDKLRGTAMLNVLTLPASLYGETIKKGISRFCADYDIPVTFMTSTPDVIAANETFIIVNSQLDWGIASLARKAKASGLNIGQDIFIISYNEFDLNEVVLDGLTTISTDFKQMGRFAANMIIERSISKVHCDFKMTRRNTF